MRNSGLVWIHCVGTKQRTDSIPIITSISSIVAKQTANEIHAFIIDLSKSPVTPLKDRNRSKGPYAWKTRNLTDSERESHLSISSGRTDLWFLNLELDRDGD